MRTTSRIKINLIRSWIGREADYKLILQKNTELAAELAAMEQKVIYQSRHVPQIDGFRSKKRDGLKHIMIYAGSRTDQSLQKSAGRPCLEWNWRLGRSMNIYSNPFVSTTQPEQ